MAGHGGSGGFNVSNRMLFERFSKGACSECGSMIPKIPKIFSKKFYSSNECHPTKPQSGTPTSHSLEVQCNVSCTAIA